MNETSYKHNQCPSIQLIDCDRRDEFVSITYKMRLSKEGKGAIVFNTSLLQIFSIGVENINKEDVSGYLEVSPNKYSYWTDKGSFKQIPKEELEVFIGKIFMKYTSIAIEGPSFGEVYIYFQGQYAASVR